MEPWRAELYHYGIKGMKWGVRRTPQQLGHDVRRKVHFFSVNRQAKKDAKEYARAKMFYGEGAGNRRKLIKARVEERSKDAEYKSRFDEHLSRQDMSKHADKAQMERHARDAVNTTAKTIRGVYHPAMGDFAKVSASAATVYALAHATGVDKKVTAWGKRRFADLSQSAVSVGHDWVRRHNSR